MFVKNFSETKKKALFSDEGRKKYHTVPIETPQSMLEDPSNGSSTLR